MGEDRLIVAINATQTVNLIEPEIVEQLIKILGTGGQYRLTYSGGKTEIVDSVDGIIQALMNTGEEHIEMDQRDDFSLYATIGTKATSLTIAEIKNIAPLKLEPKQ